MKLRDILFVLWVACCLNSAVFSANKTHHKNQTTTKQTRRHVKKQVVRSPIRGRDQLAYVLGSAINDSNVKAHMSLYVKSMRTGDTLYVYNIHKRLAPASTLKILTAEAALIYLGPDYRFSTRLLTNATSDKKGVLQGDLYVVLSGDPTLTFDDLVDLLQTLKDQKIQAISGNIYIDNTAYDQSFYGPGWVYEDKDYCYAAPISASIINRNCLSFQIAPSKKSGQPAKVITSSRYFYPQIKNSVVTKNRQSRGRCSLRISKTPGSMIAIDGCMTQGRSTSGVSYVVTDVPEYNRALFKSLLQKMGIKVYGNVTFGSANNRLSLVGSHESEPLRDIVKEMMKKSDNVIAGALFKKLGQLYTRQPGSWANGSLAVSQILSKHAKVNIAGMRILDGSGLSPNNLTTAAQMMQVLDFAYHHKTRNEFLLSLPIAGVDGTLKHRLYNLVRKVRAKTGTISGVASLAGFVKTRDQDELAFVVMINGTKGFGWRYRSLEDQLVTILSRYQGG